MKITDKIPPIRIDAYLQQSQEKPHAKGADAENPATDFKKDKVELSQTAKDVLKAREQLTQVPDVQEEKVAEIKNQIDAGTYKVDGKKIAFNMLRESIIDEMV